MEPLVSRTGSLVRVSHGCWTCRLRKKRCDERHPVCGTCAALLITCYYDREKPAWMDGGLLQEEMGRQLKLEVKEKAHLRRADQRSTHDYISEHPTLETTAPSQTACFPSNNTITHRESQNVDPTHLVLPQHGLNFYNFQFSDSVQFTFYFEHVFPFLFPFYRPCPLDGGKAWVLEMMLRSPLIRHAILCLSSHFSSLANLTCHEATLDKALSQTQDAFQMLRKALQFIEQTGTADHLRCAVRVLAGVLQIQRFEVAVLNFDNCQAHLNAATILFKQIMDSSGAADAKSKFRIITDQLGGPLMSEENTWKSNAEQATFSFSSAILMFDDIVASTMLRQAPNLYEYRHLLEGPVNMENTVGCQNWALLGIADIAALDAWKQEQKALGQLDVLEFAQRAQSVKDMLETGLEAMSIAWHETGFLEALPETSRLTPQMTTHVWAHAGLLHLSVVASGWQLTSKYIQGHVGRIIELLTALSPVVLRTIVWPFCVAGCLAMPEQEHHFRAIAQGLHPPSIFGTVHKALEVMEAVWQSRDSQRDLATCFQGRGHLVLLS